MVSRVILRLQSSGGAARSPLPFAIFALKAPVVCAAGWSSLMFGGAPAARLTTSFLAAFLIAVTQPAVALTADPCMAVAHSAGEYTED